MLGNSFAGDELLEECLIEASRRAIVDVLDDGLISGCNQPVRALDSAVMRIDRAAVMEVIHDELVFAEIFISHLLARAIRTKENLIAPLFNSSEKRFAWLLLLLANFGKPGDACGDDRHDVITGDFSHK
jgi:hypothetical protein